MKRTCCECIHFVAVRPKGVPTIKQDLRYVGWCGINQMGTDASLMRCGGDEFEPIELEVVPKHVSKMADAAESGKVIISGVRAGKTWAACIATAKPAQLAGEALAAANGPPNIKAQLDALTDDQRLELFGHYCRGCGSKDVRCQCWNDE